MRYIITGLFIICSLSAVQAQGKLPKDAEEAVQVGKLLYRSEMASWHGTDILQGRYGVLRPLIGGYFSYADGERTVCLFFTKDEVPKALIRFSFDGPLKINGAQIDTARSPLSMLEMELFAMRRSAMEVVSTDDLFEFYEGINFNLIPIVNGKLRQVYILSGPKAHGKVVIGNDYLLTFDKSNKVKEKRRLHKNIQIFEHADSEVTTTMHTHLAETGEFITPTDICTLMLYADIAGWPQHIVISETQVSIWDCNKHDLTVIERKAWDKIAKDQEERHSPER